jgi:hypothetical protein
VQVWQKFKFKQVKHNVGHDWQVLLTDSLKYIDGHWLRHVLFKRKEPSLQLKQNVDEDWQVLQIGSHGRHWVKLGVE